MIDLLNFTVFGNYAANCLARTGLLAQLRQRLLAFALHDEAHGAVAAHGWGRDDDVLLMVDLDFVSFSAAAYLRSLAMARSRRATAHALQAHRNSRIRRRPFAAIIPPVC